jgi:hypothetical protein
MEIAELADNSGRGAVRYLSLEPQGFQQLADKKTG